MVSEKDIKEAFAALTAARQALYDGSEKELEAKAALIDGERIEAPEALYDELMGLVGQRTIIACIAGQVRAGRCSA